MKRTPFNDIVDQPRGRPEDLGRESVSRICRILTNTKNSVTFSSRRGSQLVQSNVALGQSNLDEGMI